MEFHTRQESLDIYVDNSIFMSERMTGHRNRAIGHLMLNFGMVGPQIEESLELYFQQCSVLVNSRDLAVMGATLANGGVNPSTGQRAIEQSYVKYLLSIMLSCGMYDYAGEWAYRVGIPSKSGVAGGIVGVVPGQFGIGIYSPPLDSKGNSVRGIKVFEELSKRFGLHIFESGYTGPLMRDQLVPVRGGKVTSWSPFAPRMWRESQNIPRFTRDSRFVRGANNDYGRRSCGVTLGSLAICGVRLGRSLSLPCRPVLSWTGKGRQGGCGLGSFDAVSISRYPLIPMGLPHRASR